eukprot:scaffold139009_cov29-Tisochrysis_lutea.AAC.6
MHFTWRSGALWTGSIGQAAAGSVQAKELPQQVQSLPNASGHAPISPKRCTHRSSPSASRPLWGFRLDAHAFAFPGTCRLRCCISSAPRSSRCFVVWSQRIISADLPPTLLRLESLVMASS